MRRVVGFVLLGLGVFAVALGLLLRLYAYPQLAKVPLDTESTSIAEGDGITALVIESVDGVPTPEIRSNLSLKSTTYVTGDLTAPEVEADGDTAVYVEAIKTVDESSGITINASVRSLCFDRFTGEAIAPCEGQYLELEQGERITVDDRDTVQQPGLSFKFPFEVEQRDYQFFDIQVRDAVTARYDGEDTVQGLDVYRFVMEVPNTKIGEREVPGSLIGEDENLVNASRYYEGKRTLWVEPTTGIIVMGQQEMTQELVAPGKEPGDGTVVFDGTLRLNEATVNEFVTRAEDAKSDIGLLTTWPIVMWIGGAVLIVAGLVVLYTRFGRGGSGSTGGTPPRQRQPVGAGR